MLLVFLIFENMYKDKYEIIFETSCIVKNIVGISIQVHVLEFGSQS